MAIPQLGVDSEFTIKVLKAQYKSQAQQERREEMRKRIDYFNDDQLDHLDDVLKRRYKKPEVLSLQKEIDNIIKMVVEKTALVFKNPVEIIIEHKKKSVAKRNQERWKELEQETHLQVFLKQADAYVRLCNTVMGRVAFRRGGLALDLVTPDIFDVVQNTEDPTVADGVVLLPQSFVDTAVYDAKDDELIYQFFSWESFFRYKQKGANETAQIQILKDPDNEDALNPYAIADSLANDGEMNRDVPPPFFVFHNTSPLNRFFQQGGDDLINAQETINVKLTELNHLFKMQSFSIPVIIGGDKKNVYQTDPTVPIVLPLARAGETGQSDFRFETPVPKLTELLNSIADTIQRIASRYNIAPENFTLSGTPASGLSLRLQNAPLLEARQDDVERYRNRLREMCEVIRVVNNMHYLELGQRDKLIDDDIEFKFDFSEITFEEDPIKENQKWMERIEAGVASPVQWLMELNPDLTEVQAKERLAEIKEEKKSATTSVVDTLGRGFGEQALEKNKQTLEGLNGDRETNTQQIEEPERQEDQ